MRARGSVAGGGARESRGAETNPEAQVERMSCRGSRRRGPGPRDGDWSRKREPLLLRSVLEAWLAALCIARYIDSDLLTLAGEKRRRGEERRAAWTLLKSTEREGPARRGAVHSAGEGSVARDCVLSRVSPVSASET